MPTALEKLGLSAADFGAQNAAPAGTPAAAGSALNKLGLTPGDLGQAPPAAAPGVPAAEDNQLGALASGALGVGQGLTFGFSDEIAGGLAGIGSALSGDGFQSGYRSGTDAVRGLHDRSNPTAFVAGDIIGSLVIPGGAVRGGINLAAKVSRATASGAAQGAGGAFGRAEGSAAERVPEAASGAVLGGVLGGAVSAAVPAAGQRLQALARRAAPDSIEEAGDAAISAIRDAAQRGKEGVNEAYDAVAALEGRIVGEGWIFPAPPGPPDARAR